ncbi:hypothetical protein OAC78_01460 [Litorivicinus sp.]|nr:hypothetical protein [Litorivicinus sp.]
MILITILLLLVLLSLSLPSFGADFKKGLTAYNNGDYSTALKEFTPLAEQGDADWALEWNGMIQIHITPLYG